MKASCLSGVSINEERMAVLEILYDYSKYSNAGRILSQLQISKARNNMLTVKGKFNKEAMRDYPDMP